MKIASFDSLVWGSLRLAPIRCSEIASEAIFVLKFIFGLDAAGIPSPSAFGAPLAMFRDRWAITGRVPATRYGQKGHRTRQFEGGALKGKSLPRGGTCPWCPPPPPPPVPLPMTVLTFFVVVFLPADDITGCPLLMGLEGASSISDMTQYKTSTCGMTQSERGCQLINN